VNNFFKIDCPKCGQRMEVPEQGRDERLSCPACEAQFFPGMAPSFPLPKTTPVKGIEREAVREMEAVVSDLEETKARLHEARRLAEGAENLNMVAWMLIIFGGILAILTFAYGTPVGQMFGAAAGGGSVVLGFILFLVAQLLHIRAALERLNSR
jgi:hypothetical protein